MSKAFVIKNKEGKYLYEQGYCSFGNVICYAHIETDREELENLLENYKLILGKCEVVEITIAEGDLEQNENLKQQLLEKDKEIEELTTVNNYLFKINGKLLEELGEGEQQ